MKLKFIGVGSAFAVDAFNSNMVLEVKGKRLLIDAGSDIKKSLPAAGLSHRDLDAVYISHLHGDHVGGMELLGFKTYFDPGFQHANGTKKKLKLILHQRLRVPIWSHCLEAGLSSLEGMVNSLETYFDVKAVNANRGFTFGDTKFQLVQVMHFVNNGEFAPSYGLTWKAPNGQVVFLTTDTQFAPHSIKTFIDRADVVFHDCETSKYPSGIHAHYNSLKALPIEWKRKMWLYHYQDGEKPDCTLDGFAGWVTEGQEFDFSAQ
jgi:ribonuclease BN (tRNA processing enzyme)